MIFVRINGIPIGPISPGSKNSLSPNIDKINPGKTTDTIPPLNKGIYIFQLGSNDKVYRNMIVEMNEFIKQQRRLSPE